MLSVSIKLELPKNKLGKVIIPRKINCSKTSLSLSKKFHVSRQFRQRILISLKLSIVQSSLPEESAL